MSDHSLSGEQAQAIINWATGAGALLKLLDMRPSDMPLEEEVGVLRHTFETLIENMPEFFADYALDAGIEMYESYEEQEKIVEEFRRELDNLDEI